MIWRVVETTDGTFSIWDQVSTERWGQKAGLMIIEGPHAFQVGDEVELVVRKKVNHD